MPEPVWNK